MKTALVITIKNEARLLRHNLLYHFALGVDKAFIYLDGTTDNSKETIEDLEQVVIASSVPRDKYAHIHVLEHFIETYETHHTARQCLNTYDAKIKCKELQIDWLISLDADELVSLSKTEFKKGELKPFFKQLDPSIDEVRFRTFEVMSTKTAYNNVFAEETLFKGKWKFISRFDMLYKRIYNPHTKTHIKTKFWYGQNQGKSAIRVSSDLIPKNVHRYISESGKSHQKKEVPYLLHYHAFDYEDFVKKFTNMSNHPDNHSSGRRVEHLKLIWRDVVNMYRNDPGYLKLYFKDNVLFSTGEIRFYKLKSLLFFWPKEKSLVKISSVAQCFIGMNKS